MEVFVDRAAGIVRSGGPSDLVVRAIEAGARRRPSPS